MARFGLFMLYLSASSVVLWFISAFGAVAPTVPQPVALAGVISFDTDDTPVFTPDGDTVFFDRSPTADKKMVMWARRVNGVWGKPEAAPFSGKWFDQDPTVAPDGSYLLFDSDRPVEQGGKPLVQTLFGRPQPGSNIWRVDRKGDGWGEPRWL